MTAADSESREGATPCDCGWPGNLCECSPASPPSPAAAPAYVFPTESLAKQLDFHAEVLGAANEISGLCRESADRLRTLQGELEEMREARWFAMKTGFVLGATDYTVIGKDSEVIVLAGEALVRREREFEARAALSSKTETP